MCVKQAPPLTDEDLSLMHDLFDPVTEAELKKSFTEKDLPGARWLMRKAEQRIRNNRKKRDH